MKSDARAYASWVEPMAAKLRESRREVVELAQSIPADVWSRPSPTPGWSYKDLFAHLAEPEAQLAVLRAAAGNEPVDGAAFGDLDARNERRRAKFAGHTVEQLIREVAATAGELLGLLAELGEADEERQLDDMPVPLGDRLRVMTGHDQQHLPDLRGALRTGGEA